MPERLRVSAGERFRLLLGTAGRSAERVAFTEDDGRERAVGQRRAAVHLLQQRRQPIILEATELFFRERWAQDHIGHQREGAIQRRAGGMQTDRALFERGESVQPNREKPDLFGNGKRIARAEGEGDAARPEELGLRIAGLLRERGAADILAALVK